MRNSYWLGVDLGKEKFHAAVAENGALPNQWASLPNAEFANTPDGIKAFCAWLLEHGFESEQLAGVCVEATGRYAWTFVSQLDGRLGPVSIVNPARPVAFARSMGVRDKTDRVDACILALFGLTHKPHSTALPDSLQLQLRELTAHYTHENRDLIACNQRLREPIESPLVRKQLFAKVRTITARIDAIEKETDRLINENPDMQHDAELIKSIPGIGPKTCRIILAEFGDLRRYSRNELVALAGVFPTQHTSGTSVRKRPRMAKRGGGRIRCALYMAALSACRYCPQLKEFYKRMKGLGKHTAQARGAAMRKLLLLIRAVVVNDKAYSKTYEEEKNAVA